MVPVFPVVLEVLWVPSPRQDPADPLVPGVGVEVHNWATNSTRTVAEGSEQVHNNGYLRNDLRTANVIAIWLGWHDMIPNIGAPLGGPCYPHSQEVDLVDAA